MTRRGLLLRCSAAAMILAVGGAAAYQFRGLFAANSPTAEKPPAATSDEKLLVPESRPILKPISVIAEEGNDSVGPPRDPFTSRNRSATVPHELSRSPVMPAAYETASPTADASPAANDNSVSASAPASRRPATAVIGDDPPAANSSSPATARLGGAIAPAVETTTSGAPAAGSPRTGYAWQSGGTSNEPAPAVSASPFRNPSADATSGNPLSAPPEDATPVAPVNSLRNPAASSVGASGTERPLSDSRFNRAAAAPGAASNPPANSGELPGIAGSSPQTQRSGPASIGSVSSVGGLAGDPSGGAGITGGGLPGGKHLEGPQSPSLTLEKIGPPEIQVGRPATFQVKVRNIGPVAAEQVVVYDQVPKGTRLIDTTPRSTRAADGGLSWQIGTIASGSEAIVSMQILPETEGEIGSVATVTMQSQATVRTICTRPQIVIDHGQSPKVLVGETVKLQMKISNRGTGAAQNVVVEEDVPAGLSHAAGKELEYEIGTLRPGEEKIIELALKAEKAGIVQNVLVARSGGLQMAEDKLNIEVIAAQLEVALNGPKVRFLERAATYTVAVSNPGTAAAKEVELVTYLPKGMKFVAANQQGQYDPQSHAVYWSLAELPPQQVGQVELTALPIEMGEQKLRLEGRGQRGLKAQSEQTVNVEGLAALVFEVTDLADPIEVGKDTVYQIKVTNQGSKNAGNIQVTVSLPPEMKAIAGEGPTKVTVDGLRATYAVLPRLAPGENAVFKLQVRGLKAGDQRVRVQLTSDDLQTPVTKEESTRVYADQ